MNNFYQFIAEAQRLALQAFNVRQVGEAEGNAISLEEARAHLRVDTFGTPPESDDDFWLENIGIPAACAYAEGYMEQSYSPRTMELASNKFPAFPFIVLPYGPAQSVESILYDDVDGLEQTLVDTVYELDPFSNPSRIILQAGQSWPVAQAATNSVRIRYVAGYDLPGTTPLGFVLPRTVKMAILMFLGHLYENREAVNVGGVVTSMPLGVHALLDITYGGQRLDFA
jgi:uncharacterized phiE125 gp8 family phage protein